MKKNYTALLFLFFTTILSSQNSETIDSTYTKYFEMPREVPHLHLNKTSFFVGEEIWFKAYIFNLNSQKLNQNTTNLYCTIFDENGVQKDKKMLFVKNGLAAGSFKVDSTFTSKNYYIKAHTNYMKNFQEDETFLQKISIINNAKKTTEQSVTKKYDLQILPEGGHLVTNTLNTVGILLKDNTNKGEIVSGNIVDSNGKTIANFKTNQFGLAKTSFFLEENQNYSAQVKLYNGETITENLPLSNLKGITLNIENPQTSVIKVNIRTNDYTLKDLIGKKYYFLIHNTSSYRKRKIVFKENANDYTYFLSNKKMSPGVNIVTLFNEKNKPVAERMFFVYKKANFSPLEIVKLSSKKDSTTINIFKNKNSTSTHFLSASFLPYNTKANNPKNSILSKLLIKPFIKGDIQKPNYYFTDINRKKLNDLDLLLLNQGWSKYNWNAIFNHPPKGLFASENGINIKGSINMKNTQDSSIVFLFSKENDLLTSSFLKKNKFEFNNLYLKDTSNIKISISSKKGDILKPKYYLNFYPKKLTEILNPSKLDTTSSTTKIESEAVSFKVSEEFEALDEVEVKGKKIEFNNRPQGIFGHANAYKVSEMPNKSIRLIDFLRFQGFDVKLSYESFTLDIALNRGPSGINVNSNTRVVMDGIELISLDGVNNAYILYDKVLDDFDEIFIVKSLKGGIFLYSKKNLGKSNVKKYSDMNVAFGYAVEKEYYQPKYVTFQNKTFKNYGSIFWKPNIVIEQNDEQTSINFPNLYQKKVTIFIEGITSDGKIISTKKTISLENLK